MGLPMMPRPIRPIFIRNTSVLIFIAILSGQLRPSGPLSPFEASIAGNADSDKE